MRFSWYIIFLAVFAAGLLGGYLISGKYLANLKIMKSSSGEEAVNEEVKEPPEISGWIAWWKEKEGYDLVEKYPSKIKSVSPVWFFINKDLDLVDVGEINREKVVSDMESLGVLLVPCLGSALDSDELSQFLNNPQKINSLIDNLVFQLVRLKAYGVDIDLEGIKKEDRDAFSQFLFKLKEKLKENDIKLYVAIHAQTSVIEWEGVLGQDLEKIGEAADFVRIMTYDKHSGSTKSGAISPIDWMTDVARHNAHLIDKEKIVLGIPSYSYVWTKEGTESFQYDELLKYLEDKDYSEKRDKDSKELVIKSDKFEAWLSDSEAMSEKIEKLREIGFNKFVIWSLGGMDEKLFDKDWQ